MVLNSSKNMRAFTEMLPLDCNNRACIQCMLICTNSIIHPIRDESTSQPFEYIYNLSSIQLYEIDTYQKSHMSLWTTIYILKCRRLKCICSRNIHTKKENKSTNNAHVFHSKTINVAVLMYHFKSQWTKLQTAYLKLFWKSFQFYNSESKLFPE